jgi:aryl-alcohol dehydrogenase-like predicted oxidoreductase
MRYTQIGDHEASVIGLGTWQFGAKEWGWDDSRRDEAIRIVHRALELGINVIDTAEVYGRGESESIIGEALAGHRHSAFVATKVLPIFPTPARIWRAAIRSLERLRTDSVELYQIHWPNPVVPIGAQMRGMKALQDAGKVKYIGVSNFPLGMWKNAERLLGRPVMTNQVHYHLLRRKAERLLPWATEKGRVVIAYSPLAQGLLAGKYTVDNAPRDVRKLNTLFTRSNMQCAAPTLTALAEIAAKHGVQPAQIALAWLVHRPNVIAIPGARNVAQLEQNAAAADVELSEDEYARLSETSAAFHRAGLKTVPQLLGRILGR